MKGRLPRVAIVGRQNVGKSTLANRLVGRREAIADKRPGVTRDRIELQTSWRGRAFTLVDTGGYRQRPSGIETLVYAQAERAADEADVIMLVVDAQTGPVEEDAALARRLRAASVPVLAVVNKVDSERDLADASAFASLGLGDPMFVSALHGRGAGDLLDGLLALLPEVDDQLKVEREARFALVGRPNVGKSSLFNRLVGEERSVVYESAGTTRDAIDAIVDWKAGPVRFVDTAGLRRPLKTKGVEYYGYIRAVRAIDRAEVAVLILDATEGLTAEDKRIAARVIDAGRGLILVANKWDLVREKESTYETLKEESASFARAALVRTSALTGVGVSRLPDALLDVQARWSMRATTAEVNRVLQASQAERPPPRGVGVYRYGTQVRAGPPTFVLFGSKAPDPAYQRFLENRLRSALLLDGVPVRLRFRSKRGRVPLRSRRQADLE